jgi:hypothetical protein
MILIGCGVITEGLMGKKIPPKELQSPRQMTAGLMAVAELHF